MSLAASSVAIADVYTWQGGNGAWTNPAGWGTASFPQTTSDDATIGAGSVTLEADQTIGRLTLTGGSVTGTARNFTVTNGFAWSGGTLAGINGQPTSVLNATNGVEFDFTNASLSMSGWSLNLSGTSSVIGSIFRSGSVGATTLNQGATLNMGGTRLTATTFTNNGTVTATAMSGSIAANFDQGVTGLLQAGPGTSIGIGNALTTSTYKGTLHANGGNLNLTGGSFVGATLKVSNGGKINSTFFPSILEGNYGTNAVDTGEMAFEIVQVNPGKTATLNFSSTAPVSYGTTIKGGGTLINDGTAKANATVVDPGTTFINNGTLTTTNRLNLKASGATTAQFVNNGTTTLDGASLQTGTAITNTGTLYLKSDVVDDGFSTGLVRNSGAIRNSGAGAAIVRLQGDAGGSYIGTAGALDLRGTSVTGSVTATSNGSVALRSFASARNITFQLGSGGSAFIAATNIAGNFTGTGDGTGVVTWGIGGSTVAAGENALWNFSASSPLVITGSDALTVAGTLENRGTLRWDTAVSIAGTGFRNTGNITINSADTDTFDDANLGGTLTNDGIVTLSYDLLNVGTNGAVVNNGTWKLGQTNITAASGTSKFINAGLLERTSGIGVANINMVVDTTSTGQVVSRSGDLSLSRGGTHLGTLTADGGDISLGGATTLRDTAFVAKGGKSIFLKTNPTVRLAGTLTSNGDGTGMFRTNQRPYPGIQLNPAIWSAVGEAATLNLSTKTPFSLEHATMGGRDGGSITNTGAFFWRVGGTIMNDGIVNRSDNFTIEGNVLVVGCGCTHNTIGHNVNQKGSTNYQTVTHKDNGEIRFHTDAQTTNHGLWDVQGAPSFVHLNDAAGMRTGGYFTNESTGTFRKSGAGTSQFKMQFRNYGTIELKAGNVVFADLVQYGGQIVLSGGAMENSGPLTIAGGTFGGSGTVTGNVNNTGGTLAPGSSPGSLTITGNYDQSAGSLLMEIAGDQPSQYDRLTVNGTAKLNGALNVTLLDGFSPERYDSFDLFQFANVSGTFSSVSLPPLAGGMTWDTSQLYTTGVITAIPEPALISVLTIAGVGLTMRRRRN